MITNANTDNAKNRKPHPCSPSEAIDDAYVSLRLALAFYRYVQHTHCCNTICDARRYVAEYIAHLSHQGYSAILVHRCAHALALIYGCSVHDLGIDLPLRQRSIGSHAPDAVWDDRLARFCIASGPRRQEVPRITPDDVYRGSDGLPRVVLRDRSGHSRTCIATDDFVLEAAEIAAAAGQEYLFQNIPDNAPYALWRKRYAQILYLRYAHPVSTLDNEDRYYYRRSAESAVLDRNALVQVAQNLGHKCLHVAAKYLADIQP